MEISWFEYRMQVGLTIVYNQNFHDLVFLICGEKNKHSVIISINQSFM